MIEYSKIKLFFPFLLTLSLGSLAQVTSPTERWEEFKAEKEASTLSFTTSEKSKLTFLVRLAQNHSLKYLNNEKIEILRQLDQYFFIVLCTEADVQKLFPIISHWKSNDLWKSNMMLLNDISKNIKEYILYSRHPETTQNYIAQINSITQHSIHGHYLTVTGRPSDIKKYLLPINEVLYIGQESSSPTKESRVVDMNLNPNSINQIHHVYPEITGQGITISIQEQPYNPNDIDLLGRHIVSGLERGDVDDHATEMGTIMAGAGNSFITGRGVAKSASLTSSDFSDVLPDSDESYQALNITIQNHSYGTKIENFYGGRAALFDESANNNEALLHVVSSGNLGLEEDVDGPYSGVVGFANLTGNFKMAKNILVAGSVDTVGRAIPFASRGPTHDGRIRPEVVAYSTAGSSNSAALVSGMAALLQQAYMENHGNQAPSALIKAILVNSADDLGNEGPDFLTGFGNANGYKALDDLLNKRFFSGELSHLGSQNISLEIPENAQGLKITLVWNDPAAPANSNIALINDLDLQITDPDGASWNPWVLNTIADSLALVAPATRGTDRINNIEQVTIRNAKAGLYNLTISGHNIQVGPQDFYVAYNWETKSQFTWSYPTGSDNLPYNGETVSYFRWESSLSSQIGQLEYSIDAGASWVTINNAVDLTRGYYRWDAPDVNTPAIARMQTTEGTFDTDHFTISRPAKVNIGFNCTDSVLIQWQSQEKALEYTVKTIDETGLETFTSLQDTSIIIQKEMFSTSQFAIQPLYENGLLPLPSVTFDYNSLSNSCFLISFFPVESFEEGVKLRTILGTTFGVEEVHFQREINGIFQDIGTITNFDSLIVEYIDTTPVQGPNTYRTKVMLSNGIELVSESSDIYFLTEKPFLIFPNPVSNNEELFVFSREFGNTERILTLYDRSGRALKSGKLISEQDFISVAGLAPGMYFYSVSVAGQRYRGKVIIN